MLLGMTQFQIDEARAELTALCADEQELDTLATQRAEEITLLKATGSKDFAALAVLEGQRAALQTMLTEQRGYVAAAQARITALEVAHARAIKLQKIKATAGTIRRKRTELHAGITALSAVLATELPRLVGLLDDWRQQRRTVEQQAEALDVTLIRSGYEHPEVLQPRVEAVDSLFAELAELGVDVEALRLSIFTNEQGMAHIHDLPEGFPTGGGGLTPLSRAVDRVPVITAELVVRFMELRNLDDLNLAKASAV